MMLYPNGYLNINQNGEYTKHYYADALRIASKIGSGKSGLDLCSEASIIENIYPSYLSYRIDLQREEMKEELTELVPNSEDIVDIVPNNYPDFCDIGPGGQEPDLFFYHPDHLGSTGLVTNNNASVIQGLFYAPFGEIISDYNPSFHDTLMPNYAFNAKELDEENGMYYYSARYYAPPTFISRDPMFEKYPSISPYTYCANNPMKFVDPTGKEGEESDGWVKTSDGKIHFNSLVRTQEQAEAVYGEDAHFIDPCSSNESNYTSKNGEKVELSTSNKPYYTVNGELKKVPDEASTISKVMKAVKNFSANGGSSDGVNLGRSSSDMENKIIDAVAPILQGLALLNPLVGVPNGVYTAVAGEDIYGNEASTANRIISGVGVVTGGVGKAASGVVSTTSKIISKVTDAYTVIQTTREGYKKQNNK
jgi:RHS repeat-associated protein